MKYLMVALLCFFGYNISAQVLDSVPHKHDMYIHIVTADSNEVAYRNIGRFFIDNGFRIIQPDRDFYTFATDFMPSTYKEILFSIHASVTKNEIRLNMTHKRSGAIANLGLVAFKLGEPIATEYKEDTSSYGNQIWVQIFRLLEKFTHSRIYYSAN